MFQLMLAQLLVLWLIAVPSLSQPKPGCQQTCGNINISYPFGVGDDPNCFQDTKFRLFCDTTYNPPKPFFLGDHDMPILNISLLGQMRVSIPAAVDCYGNGNRTKAVSVNLNLKSGYRFSDTHNKFMAIGCNTQALISDFKDKGFQSGCVSFCRDSKSVRDDICSGIGCCQTAIPNDVDSLNITLQSFQQHNHTGNFNPCSYAFLVEEKFVTFEVSDLWNFSERVRKYDFRNSTVTPAVLDWAIGNVSCVEARKDRGSYACGLNTGCSDSTNGPGYHCNCNKGYQGNPYLREGCKDVNECDDNSYNKYCVGICSNTQGSYICSCPRGKHGDGRKEGTGCTDKLPVIQLTIGIGLSFLFVVIGTSWIFQSLQKRKLDKLKQKFFHQNGGILLQQKLSSHDHSVETTKIFSSEELKAASDNYHESRILGRGGYGTVYKGILPDKRIVAIKKSKLVDKDQIEQFINEVLILSQINHRNVVKLLGCCLETEVPLLVYEFINNGTLSDHINNEKHKYSMSWSNRLRIAAETAGALAYLHSSASQPIIHRDIKSTNILLDENYTAKVADFGASRLIALDQTQLSTLVQGTMGYLDPEYMHTSLLTDKSDVYSFGVVLVELLTGRKALSFDKPEVEKNLAKFFVTSLKTNRLFEILEPQVVSEGGSEQIQDVANLARRCLWLSSEERPTMKEVAMELEGMRLSEKHPCVEQNTELMVVAMELEGMRLSEKHPCVEQNTEDSAYLLVESAGCTNNNSGYYSIRDQIIHSMSSGR